MPAFTYTSPEFYQREVERIWRKTWNFIGSADQIRNNGDYFTLNFAGVPIIVLRDHDGKIRAFANTCRHRGSELLEGKGNCKLIVCPYHSWTYDLSGNLRGTPEMDKTLNFNKADYGLISIAIDTWGNFLFINFDKNPEPLKKHLDVCQSSHPIGSRTWRWHASRSMDCNLSCSSRTPKVYHRYGASCDDQPICLREGRWVLGREGHRRLCRDVCTARGQHGAAQGR
jgi:phenylpropionate dioxygenase-like ring-hydroxylating dioxygenase large terminal subunit